MPEQKYKKFIAGGCSFTYGNELSDDLLPALIKVL